MSETVASAFGDLVLVARERAKLTQEALALRSGLDRTTISKLELGQASPRLATLIQLAGALEMEPGELIPNVRWEPPTSSPLPSGQFRWT